MTSFYISYRLRPSTKLVSAHGLLLASFFSLAGLISMTAGFNVHYDVEQQYPYWLVVAGTVTLFIGGIVGHLGKFHFSIEGHKRSF